MRSLELAAQLPDDAQLLCLGAHCDDIEIGAGGTIMRLARELPALRVTWVILSSNPRREAEARAAADRILAGVTDCDIRIETFRNGYFPYRGEELKEYFESLKQVCNPDLILTHHLADRHQDHRLVAELTWNTWRNHLVLAYEIPKFDGDLGQPNAFVELPADIREAKIATVLECFASQADLHWFSAETLNATLRLRGIECRAESGYAEAFHARKVLL